MRLIHTSDWHLGHALYGHKRHGEFEAFLGWLVETVRRERAGVLLVTGDVFDNGTPGTRAQELYYRFLLDVSGAGCRHVVIVGGNHDSPSFLNAPRELLRRLDVHVVGQATEDPADEVLVLEDPAGVPELIVCAVPYLRDRDLRLAEAGESTQDKEEKLREGIAAHYAQVCGIARSRNAALGGDLPLVVTGHLFTSGGQVSGEDGVRDLYIGGALQVGAEVFPAEAGYVALGHLHMPQIVGGRGNIRYSGAPLPMGFSEAGRKKGVVRVAFERGAVEVEVVEVPVFQELVRVTGDLGEILARLASLAAAGSRAWLEVVYEGAEVEGDLKDRVHEAVEGTGMEVLRVRDRRLLAQVPGSWAAGGALEDLDEYEVFTRLLDAGSVPEQQRAELISAFREIVVSLHENDALAEQGGTHADP